MHGLIFQLSTTNVPRSEYINQDTFSLSEFPSIDYFQDVPYEDRNNHIQQLADNPKLKAFWNIERDNTLLYRDNIEVLINCWIENIKSKASSITADSLVVGDSNTSLLAALHNPLNTVNLFYVDGKVGQSEMLLKMLYKLSPHTTIHVGGIVDFHY